MITGNAVSVTNIEEDMSNKGASEQRHRKTLQANHLHQYVHVYMPANNSMHQEPSKWNIRPVMYRYQVEKERKYRVNGFLINSDYFNDRDVYFRGIENPFGPNNTHRNDCDLVY